MDKDEMYELPKGWAWTRLGNICQVFGGKRLPKGHTYSETQTNYSYIRVTDFEKMGVSVNGIKFLKPETQKLINKYTISKEDVYISIAGSIGKVGLVPDKLNGANLTENAAKITNLIGIEKKFMCHVLNSISSQEQIKILTSSTSQPKLALFRIKKIQLPLPSFPEQRAIVSKIEQLFSDLDNGIENFKKAQEQLKIYRQVVLKKAFEGELTKKWREEQTNLPSAGELLQQVKEEQEKHHQKQMDKWKTAVKDWEGGGKEGKKPTKSKKVKELLHLNEKELVELPELPERWQWDTLENITMNITDGDHQPPPKSKSGIPFITISNIKSNKIDFSSTFFVNQEYYDSLIEYRKPRKGDILYTVTGSFGIPVIINFNNSFCFQRHIGLVRPYSQINNKWLFWLFKTNLIFNQAQKTATGTAQKTVALSSLRKFKVPLCSIQEQHRIVTEVERRLSICDKMEETITESLQKAESLRQSILKKAFEGKLLNEKELEEVRNAPDWEPAEKLLERIKAEKTNTKAKKKGKK